MQFLREGASRAKWRANLLLDAVGGCWRTDFFKEFTFF